MPMYVFDLPAVMSQPVPEIRYATTHRIVVVVGKQLMHETYIGPALSGTRPTRAGTPKQQQRCVHVDARDPRLLYGRLHHCHDSWAVHCEDLAAEKEFVFDVIIFCFCYYYAFNYWCWCGGCSIRQGCYWGQWRLEDWDSIFRKKVKHQLPYSSPRPYIVASYTLCCCCTLAELYHQLVFHCFTGA